ncbi:MAG: hypothetical protein JXJ19_07605 [Elusimicrobia bacterium]|nr:hypothetical protein [Elusimicrobiota bacterium]
MRNISRDIKPLGVIKCKFKADEVSIYGLLLFIFNSRNKRIIRYAAVTGCNPEIYESDVDKQWFAFEKDLYSRRLKDGSLREITQKIEEAIVLRIQEEAADDFYSLWEVLNIDGIKDIFSGCIIEVIRYDTGREYDIFIEMKGQKINLRQFKYLTDAEKINDEFMLHLGKEDTENFLIDLDIDLVKNKDANPSIRVEKVEAGDMVVTRIIDDRDIGVYLAHLLGGRKEDELISLPATVEDVKDTEDGVEIIVRYGPGIIGRAVENPKKKIGIIKTPMASPFRWWYIIIAFVMVVLYYFLVIK